MVRLMVSLTHVSHPSLCQHTHTQGAYSEAQTSEIMRQIVDAVTYLHQQGIVHCDLKPEVMRMSYVLNKCMHRLVSSHDTWPSLNPTPLIYRPTHQNLLLATKASDASDMRLVDFGSAFRADNGKLVPRKGTGTIAYSAPEVISGKVRNQKMSGRSDTTSFLFMDTRASRAHLTTSSTHPRTALRLQGGHLGPRRAHVHPALGLPPVRPHERRGRRPDRAAHRQGTFVCLFP